MEFVKWMEEKKREPTLCSRGKNTQLLYIYWKSLYQLRWVYTVNLESLVVSVALGFMGERCLQSEGRDISFAANCNDFFYGLFVHTEDGDPLLRYNVIGYYLSVL